MKNIHTKRSIKTLNMEFIIESMEYPKAAMELPITPLNAAMK